MKKQLFAAFLFLAGSFAALQAQNSVSVNVSVTENTENEGSSSVRSYNRVVSRNADDEWCFNLLSFSPAPISSHKGGWKTDISTGIDRFFFGVAGLPSDGFDLKAGNSLEFGFSVLTLNHWSPRRHFGVTAELDIAWTRYQLQHNDVFQMLGDELVCAPIQTIGSPVRNYSNSRMTYASWRLPVMLNYRNNGFSFGAGLEGELRHHLRSRIKEGKDKKHYEAAHDMSVNPYGLNAVASMGFRKLHIYGRVGLTEFFDQDHTSLSASPFSVGFSLDL